MDGVKEFRRALAISILAALMTAVPYLIAQSSVEPDAVFSGFLINPIDGFSYLAKMRQGSTGGWLFHLPYAVDPGEGTLLFTYHIFLGKLVNLTGWAPIFLYHSVRVAASGFMFFLTFLLIKRFVEPASLRWKTYILIVFASGFGWLGLPFGMLASDLKIPESIPFYSAYTNAHFPLATALFLGILLLVVNASGITWKRFGSIALLSTLLAMVQPFPFIVLGSVFIVWQIWEVGRKVRENIENLGKALRAVPWWSFFAIVIGAAPWLVYDFLLTLNHSALSQWNQQNLTPSPPLGEFLLGFGGIIFLAVVGMFKTDTINRRLGRLLIVWSIVQFALLYAPFGLQRRLSLGLFFPLAILAMMALERIVRVDRLNLVFALLMFLSIPSNLVVIASGLANATSQEGELVMSEDELAGYHWLGREAEDGALVLANLNSGNRIPAFSNTRVLYGHPFETPHADRQEILVQRLLSPEGDQDAVLDEISRLGVRYVFIGPDDLEQGELAWLGGVQHVFSSGPYSIYELTP